ELPPIEAGGEVTVGEPEPVRGAELHQPVEDGERIALDSPAALLDDLAGRPIGDQVGVGGDVDARDLDVVPGVGDHRKPASQQILQPGRQLRAAGAAGELDAPAGHAQWSPSGRSVMRIPARALWRTLTAISSAVRVSAMRAISSGPALTARRPSI